MRGGLGTATVVAALLVPSAQAGPVEDLNPFKPEPPPNQQDPYAPAQPQPSQPPPAAPKKAKKKPKTRIRLSNERTRSRWAYVLDGTIARARPSRKSRRVKRLRTYTSDNTPELVLVLEERLRPDRSRWVRVRLPMRPNNTTAWVPRKRLGRYHVVTTALKIDRRRFRATLYKRGRRVWTSRIGVGERHWPTPRGRFYVRNRLIPRDSNGIYGVFAFGTSAYSRVLTDWPGGGVIGIHGTNEPGLIPGRISHGCVRVRNGNIRRLRRLMPLGTPIKIV